MSAPTPLTVEKIGRWLSFDTFSGMLLLLTGLAMLGVLVEAVRFLPVTGDNVYPEASNIVVAQRWASGFPLYADPRQPPYLLAGFPPLWYAGLAVAHRVGVSELDALTLFGRLLNLAALLASAGLGYLWGRWLGFPRRLALLTPTLYLSFPILIPWAVAARPDFPTLFFSLLAACVASFRLGTAGVVLAGVSAAVAFLVKQSSVAVPTAIVLWLLSSRRWRHAVLFVVTWWLLVGATLVGFEVSDHGAMSLNLSGHHFGTLSLAHVHDTVVRLWKPSGSGFALALLALGAFGFCYAWGESRSRLLGIYFATALGFALLGSAVSAGNVNYYFEPAFLLALLTPVGLDQLRRQWARESPMAGFVAITMLVLLLPSLDVQRWKMFGETPPDLQRVVPLVKEKRLLTDIPYLGARSALPELLDPVSQANLEREGGWSADALVERILEKDYDLVILHLKLDDPRWDTARYLTIGSGLRTAIAQTYAWCFEMDSTYVYGRAVEAGPGVRSGDCPSRTGQPSL